MLGKWNEFSKTVGDYLLLLFSVKFSPAIQQPLFSDSERHFFIVILTTCLWLWILTEQNQRRKAASDIEGENELWGKSYVAPSGWVLPEWLSFSISENWKVESVLEKAWFIPVATCILSLGEYLLVPIQIIVYCFSTFNSRRMYK